MPRLNDQEQATTGLGAYWFDGQRTILQDCLFPTAPFCRLRLSDGTPISDRGDRIHLEARGGRWVSQDGTGVYGSFGEFPGAAIASGPSKVASELIGPDGSLIYKLRYQSTGPWFNTATGRQIPGDGDSWQNLGRGDYIVRRGNGDIEDQAGQLLGRGYWPRARGDGHMLYQALSGELVFDGRVVAPPSPKYYRPDYSARSDGSVLIVWARDEGEIDIPPPLVLTAAELAAAPLYRAPAPLPVPVFRFAHPVLIAPFKDHEGGSGAPAEIIVNQCAQSLARPYFVAEDSLDGPFRGERLGVYTERADLTALFAKFPRTRLLVGHDDVTDWNVTALRLRPFDIPMLELYFPRVRGVETVAQSVARWVRQAVDLLRQWPGDCALDPQFYLMGSSFPWLYTEAEVLEGLARFSDIANLSPRFKLILPFAFLRENGISKSPALRAAFDALLAAAEAAGRPVLLPVPMTPPPPPPPPPPAGFYKLASRYEVVMIKRVALRLGQFFASVDPNDKYPDGALKGWGRVRFKKESKQTDAACAFQLSTPRAGDPRLLIRPESIPAGALSIDATEFSGDIASQFSIKPNVSEADWGGYEAQHGWALGLDGIDIVLVEYDRDGQKYASACLTVVEL